MHRGALRQSLLHQMEGAAPAGLVEEVDGDVEDKAYTVADGGLIDLVFRSDERPVNEKWAAHDIFARHKTPVAAVKAHGAIVAHGEIMALRDDQVVSLNMGRKLDGPFGGYVSGLGGSY